MTENIEDVQLVDFDKVKKKKKVTKKTKTGKLTSLF